MQRRQKMSCINARLLLGKLSAAGTKTGAKHISIRESAPQSP